MIIEPYRVTTDLGNERSHIYVRHREGGGLVEEFVTDFRPYFFVEDGPGLDRLCDLYDEFFHGWERGEKANEAPDGRPLIQILAPSPSDIKRMRDMADESWEADIVFPDRFCIDTYDAGDFPDWYDDMVIFGGFDLEWNEEGEITAMGYVSKGRTFQWAWHPSFHTMPFGASIYLFPDEKAMLEIFAKSFQSLNPDLITTWAGNRADWPKIYERYKHHGLGLDWISPLSDKSESPPMKHLPRSGFYEEGTQIILGRLTLDLADRNHGFERVWKDSGNGQLSDRRLGEVGKVAFPDNPEYWKVELADDMTHHELWENHFGDFLKYHRGDLQLTDRLDRSYHVSRFFMALQRVCGVSFGSVFTVSRFARGLLRRRALTAAPTGSYGKGSGGSYAGAFVALPKPGRHEMVGVFDFAAMYAEIQRAYNISPETLCGEDGECWVPMSDDIVALEDGTYWDQSAVGILPQLQMDLADARNEAKEEMKKHDPTSSEYAGFNTLQLAFKRGSASVYGLMGHHGHGESNRTVAATITYVGRKLVRRLMAVCEEMGLEPLAGHTDSAYIGIGDRDGHQIAAELTKRIQREFDSDRFVVEYEKLMKSWVAAKKNRNFGWAVWPKEGLHCTGFEMKKSNSSGMTKVIQETAFTSLSKELASEEDIRELVKVWIFSVRTTVKREALVMRSRLGKDPESYDHSGGFQGAARRYNTLNPEQPFVAGDGVPHTYTTKGIEAFRTTEELAALDMDWTTIISKQIIAPVSLIFEAMGWREPTADGSEPEEWW